MNKGPRVLAGLPLAAALLLTACAEEPPSPAATPTRQVSDEAFRSERQAEVELRTVLEQYLGILSRVLNQGGRGAEKLHPLLTDPRYERDLKTIESLTGGGGKVAGQARLHRFFLQSVDLKNGEADAYACIDVSDTVIEDAAGKIVTPAERSDMQRLLVTFERGPRIDSSEVWDGADICSE